MKSAMTLQTQSETPAPVKFTNKHGTTSTMNTENIARPASLLNFRCLAAFDLLKP